MNRLIEFALTKRVMVVLAAVAVAGLGWFAFRDLPIDAFPDVSPTQVKVIVKAPGMTPEEVESQITAPIELELLGIPRQVMLRSVAKYALSDITVDFAEGTDIYWARQQVAERLAGVWENLPPDIEGGVAPMTTPHGAGRMTEGEEALLVRSEGRIRTLDDVRAMVVSNVVSDARGVPIRVGDIADVRIGTITRYGAVTQNGEAEAVQRLVLGLRGANARQAVVVENIVTHLGEWRESRRLPRLHVIYRAVREVSVRVASGIGIIIIVFFPLLTLQGLEGKLFTPVALTIVFALTGSLLLSMTVIPVLSSFLLRKVSHRESWLPRKLEAL